MFLFSGFINVENYIGLGKYPDKAIKPPSFLGYYSPVKSVNPAP